MADPQPTSANRPRPSVRTGLNAAAAVVLVGIAAAYPTQRLWVFLVLVTATIGELIRWRRARRGGDDAWRPLKPSSTTK